MEKRKVDDETPKRSSRAYLAGIVLLVIILVFSLMLSVLTPKMEVFPSVLDALTETADALSSITPTPNP